MRPGATSIENVRSFVEWGAGPRAGQALILSGKAKALLDGRFSVTLEDLRGLVPAVLRHRVLINFRGQAERITAEKVACQVLEEADAPRSPLEE